MIGNKSSVLSTNNKVSPFIMLLLSRYFSNYAGLSKLCWQGIAISFIEATLSGVCFFLSIYFVNTLHLDIAAAGLIISFYGLGRTVGGIAGGRLSDRVSPSVVSVVSLIIQSISFLVLVKIKTMYFLMIDLFVLGVATYGFITSNNVWVLNHCKNHEEMKLKTLSMLHASSNLGIGLSAVLVGTLSRYGFSCIFLLAGGLLFLLALYQIFVEKNAVAEIEKAESVKVPSVTAVVETSYNKAVVWMVLGCLFLVGLTIAQLGSTYSLYINDTYPKLGIDGVSLLFALNSFLIVVAQTPLVNFFKNYNKILMTGIGAFLMGFGMFMLSFSVVFSMAVIACIVYTIGEMLFFSMAQLVCYQSGGAKKKGQSLGLFRTVFAASVFVGPTLGGYLYHRFGADFVWYACGLIGLVCLFSCLKSKNATPLCK
jgi:predicted MFS family arabinose efflux permease